MNKTILGLSFLLIALVPTVRANPITFTVTATAYSGSNYGYIEGQSYTFVYTTGDSFTNSGRNNYFGSADNSWTQYTPSEDTVWSTLGGTALTGSFTYSQTDGAEVSLLAISAVSENRNQLTLSAALHVLPGNLGLATADASVQPDQITANIVLLNYGPFNYTSSYTDPRTYFSDHTGEYAFSGDLAGDVDLVLNHSLLFRFIPTHLTISTTTAVPEPSTYAAICGGVALIGATLWRRRPHC